MLEYVIESIGFIAMITYDMSNKEYATLSEEDKIIARLEGKTISPIHYAYEMWTHTPLKPPKPKRVKIAVKKQHGPQKSINARKWQKE